MRMRRILEELYHGNINPTAKQFHRGTQYDEALRCMCQNGESLNLCPRCGKRILKKVNLIPCCLRQICKNTPVQAVRVC